MARVEVARLGSVPVFARQATGLVREIGPWRAFLLTFGWMNLGSGAATLFAFALFMYPGAQLWIPLTLGMINGLIYGWVYVLLGHAMPRSGGDYVWTSRILHPAVGFGISLLWMFLSMFLLAYQMSITTTVGISTSFGIMGAIFHNPSLVDLGAHINTPTWSFVVGTALLLMYALLNIFSLKWTFRVLTASLLLGILSFFIMVFLLAITSHDQFVLNYNNLFGAGAYDKVINVADSSGYLVAASIGASILATPIAFLAYEGFNYSVNAGGEIRRTQRSMILSIMGAQVLGWIGLTVISLVAVNTVGYKFASGISSIFYKSPDKYTLGFPPWLNALAGIAGSNLPGGAVLVGVALVGFVVILSIFGGILPFLISRNLFAAAFDRILPSKLSDVNDKYHTPVWSLIVVFVLAEAFLAIYTFTTFFTLLVNYITGRAFAIAIVGVAAMVFPYVKRDLFESAPKIVRMRIAGIPVISIVGLLTFVTMAVQFFILAGNPALSGPTSGLAIGLFPGLVVLGGIVYFVSAYFQRRRGLDVKAAFSEIPPE